MKGAISQYKNKINQHINQNQKSNTAPITTPMVIHTPTKTTVIQPHPKVQSSLPSSVIQEPPKVLLLTPIATIIQEKVSNISSYPTEISVTPSISPPKTITTSETSYKSISSEVTVITPKINKEQVLQEQLSKMQSQLFSEQQNLMKQQEVYQQEVKILKETLEKQEKEYKMQLQRLEQNLKEQTEAHTNEINRYAARLAVAIPLPNEESEVEEEINDESPRLSDAEIQAQNLLPVDISPPPSPLNINFSEHFSESDEYVNVDLDLLGDNGIF